MEPLSEQRSVGVIAAQVAGAWRIFLRHRIDFCCRGGTLPIEAARSAGVDPERLLAELRELVEAGDVGEAWTRWTQSDAQSLLEHLESGCHEHLLAELPWVRELAQEVADAEAGGDPRLVRVAAEVGKLADELLHHVLPMERQVFASIRRGTGSLNPGQIRALNRDHQGVADALARLRDLTDDHNAPQGASSTRRELVQSIRELDRSLRLQMHLENNILFPGVLLG